MEIKKRTRKLHKETLPKTMVALNEINQQIKKDHHYTTLINSTICKRNHVNTALIYVATELGYFEKIGRSQYKSKKEIFEPIDAKKIVDRFNNNKYFKRKTDKPYLPKETPKIVVKRKYVRRKNKVSFWSRLNPLNWF